jgi:predicted enzyme related to lactoylglutathione lyase
MFPKAMVLGLFLALCPLALCAQQSASPAKSSLRTSGLKINVDDMDKALSFYGGKLGFEIADRSDYPRQVVLKTDDSFKLILNRVALLQKAGPGDTQVGLTLQVNDLNQAIEKMRFTKSS